MRILTILTGRRISAVMAAVIALTACKERTASRPAVPQEVGEKSRQFTITDSTSSSGGHRKPGECARALTDRESGTRLVLRGWDERSIRSRRGTTTTAESFEHGFYAPADAKAVALAPGQEYEVDCRTFMAVGVNTPDLRPASLGR
jgi:hypothetical protein